MLWQADWWVGSPVYKLRCALLVTNDSLNC